MSDIANMGVGLAAYILTTVMLAVLYLGLLSFIHRATNAWWEHLGSLILLIVSVPFIGMGAFAVLPPVLGELIAPGVR